MPRSVIALSGGLDSAVLLAYVKGLIKTPITAVSFLYGSKHNPLEIVAACNIARYYGVRHETIDLTGAFLAVESALLVGGKAIPEGHYNDESMRQTVVPARNMIFSSIMTAIAASGPEYNLEATGLLEYHGEVYIGIHAGDHFIYPDCRPDFFHAMRRAVLTATDIRKNPNAGIPKGVEFSAPFLLKSKKDIVHMGLQLNVPFSLTRTCYTDNTKACGKCGSCCERLEAFQLNDAIDPIPYQ